MRIFALKKDIIKLSLFNLLILSSLVTAPQNILFTPVKAQNGGGALPAASSITISPPSFELTSNPGDELTENVIKVTNTSASTATFEAVVEDFRVEGNEGVVQVRKDENPNAFSSWFTIEPETFTLKRGEVKTVKFTVNVPDDGEPGGHFASVMFQPKAVESESGSGAQILQRVGALVLMTVSGDVKEEGSISTFAPKTYVGEIDILKSDTDASTEYFVPLQEKLDEEKRSNYFSQGPVAFELVMKNEGNVYYRTQDATVTIKNIFGQKVDEIKVQPRNVFPGAERRATLIWPKKNLWGIRYTAELNGIYGQKEPKQIGASTSFWAFPLPAAIAIGVVLLILVFLRKRLLKAISILAKG